MVENKDDITSKIPNQNSLGDIINQFIAVKALNTMMDVVIKSDAFAEIHNIGKGDIILYTDISKMFLENFIYIQEKMSKIKKSSLTNLINSSESISKLLTSILDTMNSFVEKTDNLELLQERFELFRQTVEVVGNSINGITDIFKNIFSSISSIFALATLTGVLAAVANKTGAWDNIKQGIIGAQEVLKTVAGNNDLDRLKEIGYNLISSAHAQATGKGGIGTGSKGDKVKLMLGVITTFRKIFIQAIITGALAKKANDRKVWKDIKAGIREVNKIGELAGEESIFSVLQDKLLGINEIALAEFNRDFMKTLNEVFLVSIVTGISARIANNLKVWKDIKKATKQVHEIYLILFPLVSSLALFKAIDIDPVEAFGSITKIFMLLPVVFGSMVIAGLFAKPLKNLWKPLLIGIGILTLVALAIGGLTYIISMLEQLSGGNIAVTFLKLTLVVSLLAPIFVMLSLAALLALPLKILWKPLLIGIAVLTAVVIGLGAIGVIMEKASVLSGIAKLNLALLLLGIAFVQLILISVLVVLSALSWPLVLLGIAVLGLISLSLLLIIVPKTVIKNIARLDLALLGLVVAFGLLVVLDFIMSMISVKSMIMNILGIIAIMGMIALLFVAMLFMTPILLLASISVIVSISIVGMILLIAGALKLLEFIKLDKDKIRENIDIIVTVINDVLGIFKESEANKDNIPKIDEDTWKVDKLLAIMTAIPLLAGAFIAISFIILISLELLILQFISIDRDKVLNNVAIVMDTITAMLDRLFQKPKQMEIGEEDSAKSKIGKLLFNNLNTNLSRFNAVVDMMLAVPMLLAAVVAVGLVLITAKLLQSLAKIEFTANDEQIIHNNIDTILRTINYLNNAISAPYKNTFKKEKDDNWVVKGLKSLGNKVFSGVGRFKDLVEALSNTGTLAVAALNIGLVKVLAENLKTIQDVELDETVIRGKVDNIMLICKSINERLNSTDIDGIDSEKVDLFGRHVGNIKDFIGSINKVNDKKTEAFVKVLDKANSIDTDKIKSVRDMFEQMARFSESIQGDFEKLADVLSEKLVDILDKLNTTIENVQGIPATGAASPAIATSAASPATATGAEVKTDKPEKPNQAIERLIGYVDGIEDALEKLNQSVNSYHRTGIKTTI